MKKALSLFMAVLMSALLLASCSDGGTNSETATESSDTSAATAEEAEAVAEEEPEFKAESTLTIKDNEGAEFRAISTNQDSRHVDIIAEELTGATLNDLVFQRNSKICDLYNVSMKTEQADYGSINSMVTKDATSGDISYHLYLTNYTAHPLGTSGYLYDFYQIPYVDLSQEWWDQNEKDDMTVGGKLFLAIGDISPTELLTSECILFNKQLFDDQGITYPYSDALEGTWTLDKLCSIADGLTRDLNGDGEINVDDDLFSITCWSDYPTAMFYGAGGDLSYINDAGEIVLDIDEEKCVNIYNKIYKAIIDTQANFEISEHERSFSVFNEGRAYFCGITFQKIETFLREMENDYGILPNPKYDENQENYSTCVSGAGSMVVVPSSVSGDTLDFIGMMLEAMAAISYDDITPDLINVLASTKNARDKESSEICQMIIRNRNFDSARMHDISADGYVESLLKSKSTDVSSYFAKQQKLWNKTLEKVNKAYSGLSN